MSGRSDAITIYRAALEAVQPSILLPQYIQLNHDELIIDQKHIPLNKGQHIYIIGAGKASAAMAQATEKILGHRINGGIIVTKYDHALPLQIIECVEAAHPVPDENSLLAVEKTKELLQKVKEGDIIICLLSGGASSLWADVPESVSLNDQQQLFLLLLSSGATIEEMNTIRKHLSSVKGGQLLRYAPTATWFSFIISDVPGNQLETIASGPTVADPSTFEKAMQIIKKYQLQLKLPFSVLNHIEKGKLGLIPETVKANDTVLKNVHTMIIGNNTLALQAAQQKATELGYHTMIHNAGMVGEAGEVVRDFIKVCKKYKDTTPACLLMGGETTVTVTGKGKGGRNQHMALCALVEMMERHNDEPNAVIFLSAGTDGTDGPTDAAGAIADIETVSMAVQKKLMPQQYIDNNDAYHFFQHAGGLLKTGPTQTNVMDIVVALID